MRMLDKEASARPTANDILNLFFIDQWSQKLAEEKLLSPRGKKLQIPSETSLSELEQQKQLTLQEIDSDGYGSFGASDDLWAGCNNETLPEEKPKEVER